MPISFDYRKDNYKLFDEDRIAKWLKNVIKEEKKRLGEIEIEFVTEDEILEVNKNYLNHDYFTDIITFDECFVNIINGKLIISADTVLYNAQKNKISWINEILRVIVHGIMHLCGYKDASNEQKSIMRKMEDKYLHYLEKL